MKKNSLKGKAGVSAAIGLLATLAPVFQACDTKQYENCPESDIIGTWGVTKDTKTFGEFDSLYYIINPIGNVSDSLYFNGNYTDSYYHSDSTRVMLRYTTSDSIIFHIDRMYAVQTNPTILTVKVKSEKDTVVKDCELKLRKDDESDKIFRCGPDSLFRELLMSGGMLRFSATNGPSTSEPAGSQNYEFFFDASGFKQALTMADSLNNPAKYQKLDSIKAINSEQKEKKEARETQRRHAERHLHERHRR